MMDLVADSFRKFINTNDFATPDIQKHILAHKSNISFLNENITYVNSPELSEKFVIACALAVDFKKKQMDESVKMDLLWPPKLRQ